MAETYHIECVTTTEPHEHIVSAVILGNSDDRTTLSVTDIRTKLAAGDFFYTYGPESKKIAYVEADTCSEDSCDYKTIRSKEDAVKDNNLDNLICP